MFKCKQITHRLLKIKPLSLWVSHWHLRIDKIHKNEINSYNNQRAKQPLNDRFYEPENHFGLYLACEKLLRQKKNMSYSEQQRWWSVCTNSLAVLGICCSHIYIKVCFLGGYENLNHRLSMLHYLCLDISLKAYTYECRKHWVYFLHW